MPRQGGLEQVLFDLGRGKGARFATLLLLVVAAGAIHGVSMGSFRCSSWDRAWLLLYGGLKVPILLLGSALLCVPGFVLINAALGLRSSVRRALRAVFAGQAVFAVSLCSLSPLVLFAYACGVEHRAALLLNAAAFSCAALRGQLAIRRHYEVLVAEDAKHRLLLWAWVTSYVFVGIQMGWLLRPFVGEPSAAVTFLRAEPFSNAYMVVIQLLLG